MNSKAFILVCILMLELLSNTHFVHSKTSRDPLQDELCTKHRIGAVIGGIIGFFLGAMVHFPVGSFFGAAFSSFISHWIFGQFLPEFVENFICRYFYR